MDLIISTFNLGLENTYIYLDSSRLGLMFIEAISFPHSLLRSFYIHYIPILIILNLTIVNAATHSELSIAAFVTRAGKVSSKLTNLCSSRQFAPESEAVC